MCTWASVIDFVVIGMIFHEITQHAYVCLG